MLPAFPPCARSVVLTLSLGLCSPNVFAQPAAPVELPLGSAEGVEMLTRGPLHEAFADQVSQDLGTGVLAPSAPPEAIEELPPEIKPDGDDVQWIPGYWYWDDERDDYIWISGVWRKTPPGRRWVPGYWTEVVGKYRRVSGVWSGAAVADLEFLPYPPESLEHGPVSPAPSDNDFWVPGQWVYHNHGYSWRPGHWERFRNDWVWMPARYIWSPGGCLYQPGYWDYPLASRGQLYCPVYFQHHVYQQPHFRFRPSITISTSGLFLHLFVRSGHNHYYFGNYYGNQHRNHYHPWYDFHRVGRRYDPLITHTHGRSRHVGVDYVRRMRDWNHYLTSHAEHRPPSTIKHQRDFERRHKDFAQSNHVALGRSIKQTLDDRDSHVRSHRTSTAQQEQLRKRLAQVRKLTDSRRHHEANSSPKQRAGLAATTQRGSGTESRSRSAGHGINAGSIRNPSSSSTGLEAAVRSGTPASDRIGRGTINRVGANPTPANDDVADRAGRAAHAGAAATAKAFAGRRRQLSTLSSRAPTSNSSPSTRGPRNGPNTVRRGPNEPSSPSASQANRPRSTVKGDGNGRSVLTTRQPQPAVPTTQPGFRRSPATRSQPTLKRPQPATLPARPARPAASSNKGLQSALPATTQSRSRRALGPQPGPSRSRASFSRSQPPKPTVRNSSPVGRQRSYSSGAPGGRGRRAKRDDK